MLSQGPLNCILTQVVELEIQLDELRELYNNVIRNSNSKAQQKKMAFLERNLEQLTLVQKQVSPKNPDEGLVCDAEPKLNCSRSSSTRTQCSRRKLVSQSASCSLAASASNILKCASKTPTEGWKSRTPDSRHSSKVSESGSMKREVCHTCLKKARPSRLAGTPSALHCH